MSADKIWMVANAASGSAEQLPPDELGAALSAAGFAVVRTCLLPGDALPEPCALAAAKARLVVVHAGDGTVNAVVARLGGWQGQVLVLPGGTQNLFARRLHGDADARSIVAALGEARLKPVHVPRIESAHGFALSEVIAGPGATWSDLRETMRDGDLAAMAASFAEAVRLSAGGPTVHMAEPAAGRGEGYPALRLHLQERAIAADGYAADGVADYARQGAAILRRDFRSGPHEELGGFTSVVLRSEGPIELALDGERVTGGREERFSLSRCDVEFLALGN